MVRRGDGGWQRSTEAHSTCLKSIGDGCYVCWEEKLAPEVWERKPQAQHKDVKEGKQTGRIRGAAGPGGHDLEVKISISCE
jgi:hypothetical protein